MHFASAYVALSRRSSFKLIDVNTKSIDIYSFVIILWKPIFRCQHVEIHKLHPDNDNAKRLIDRWNGGFCFWFVQALVVKWTLIWWEKFICRLIFQRIGSFQVKANNLFFPLQHVAMKCCVLFEIFGRLVDLNFIVCLYSQFMFTQFILVWIERFSSLTDWMDTTTQVLNANARAFSKLHFNKSQ